MKQGRRLASLPCTGLRLEGRGRRTHDPYKCRLVYGSISQYSKKTYCVVPPILMAGGTPLKASKLFKQVCVADKLRYPGNAKNSMETLSSAGSTVTALSGMLDGIVNVMLTADALEDVLLHRES